MFDKILFAPGLYLNEEEITLFGIAWDKDSLPSRKEYIWAMETKLEKSILRSFENFILESYGEHELAELITNYTYGVSTSLGVEELKIKFQKKLVYALEDDWTKSEYEAINMEVDSPSNLANQLIDQSYLYGMLSSFYDRIEILQKGQSLEKHYLETERMEEGGTLEEYSIDTFNYDYCSLVFPDFFELSAVVKENMF